jgi:hypothetical protein
MDLQTYNVKMCLTGIMFAQVFLGFIPAKKCEKVGVPLSLLNCLSSGIYIATVALYLIPQAFENE